MQEHSCVRAAFRLLMLIALVLLAKSLAHELCGRRSERQH